MIHAGAALFRDLSSTVVLVVLLVPLGVAAAKRAAGKLDLVEAVAVGIGAVIALMILAGLVLSVVHALGAAGWLVVVGAVAAVVLLAGGDRSRLARRALILGLVSASVGLTVGALALSRSSARDHARETRFTQLWFIPHGPVAAEIGVRDEEQSPAAFELKMFAPASLGGRPLLDRVVRLTMSRSWVMRIRIPRTARPERVNAELYRLGQSTSYRSAHVWTTPAP